MHAKYADLHWSYAAPVFVVDVKSTPDVAAARATTGVRVTADRDTTAPARGAAASRG